MVATPVLILHPLEEPNATAPFAPKALRLQPGERIVLGRQTCAESTPTTLVSANDKIGKPDNGWFWSTTISRAHAEVWAEGDKVLLKDTKSFNGTYINGERLSNERDDSRAKELKTDDILVLGIDVLDEDKSTVIHQKIAARVECLVPDEATTEL